MELTLDRLTREFGPKIAVDRLSATLTPGVHGLLGANGAGKTTLMRMVCGVLRPTSGEVRYDGVPVARMGDAYRALLGYLPQDFGYYPEFTALDFMEYMAALKGLDRRLSEKTNIPFHIAEDPLRAVARGTGIALKNIGRFSFLMR